MSWLVRVHVVLDPVLRHVGGHFALAERATVGPTDRYHHRTHLIAVRDTRIESGIGDGHGAEISDALCLAVGGQRIVVIREIHWNPVAVIKLVLVEEPNALHAF